MKRLAREAAAAANPMLSPEVHRMAQQVQEVLPHISIDQIKRDLGKCEYIQPLKKSCNELVRYV